MSRKSCFVCLGMFFALSFASAQPPLLLLPKVLSLGTAGVATPNPDTVIIAAPLANLGTQPVHKIRIEHIKLAGAALKTSLPIKVGTIAGRASEIVQAEFASKGLVSGKKYELVVKGTYRLGGKKNEKDRDDKDSDGRGPRRPFTVRTPVVLPPASPGSKDVGKAQAQPHKTRGGYPPQPHTERDANQAALWRLRLLSVAPLSRPKSPAISSPPSASE